VDRTCDNEPRLGFTPVRMEMAAIGETLPSESRANYNKLVTVEHNVKVFFIGYVVPDDWGIFIAAVYKCWADRIHCRRLRATK
jgi:hypothetical protein